MLKEVITIELKDFEKARKRYYPIYLGCLVSSFVLMLAVLALFFINLGLNWWQFTLIAVGTLLLIFLLIFVANLVERRYMRKYNSKFQELFVNPVLLDLFGKNDGNKRELDLKDVKIIGKAHKFKIINETHTNKYSIFEISMLHDLRFRGFVIIKPLEDEQEDFLFTNYDYYFRPKFKEHKILSGDEKFDSKFILYSNNKNFKMPPRLADKLFNRLSTFNHVGVMIKNKTAYYVLGSRINIKSGSPLNISIVDPIDEDIEMKLKIFIQKLQSIAEYNFD